MLEICQATPAPRVIMTEYVVDKSVLFFWFNGVLRLKTSFAFAAFRSRLPPSDPTPRGKAESIAKYSARLGPVFNNALRIEMSSALGANWRCHHPRTAA